MYEIENCRQIVLTSEEEWLPYSSHFQELEDQAKGESDIFILKLKMMSTQTIRKNLFIQGQEIAK